jgi:hypothetical protein
MEGANMDYFKRWVEAAVAKLRELPNGDGAFAVMAIAFGLYERFLDSRIHSRGESPDPSARNVEASKDFDGNVSADDFKIFWEMYRVGVQHYFQPKHFTKFKDNTRWGWDISENKGYKSYPEIVKRESDLFLVVIDPWKFAAHVIDRWRSHPELMDELSATKLGRVEGCGMDKPASGSSSSGQSYVSVDPPPMSTGIYPGAG